MAHSRAVVEVAGVRAENERSYPAQTRQWVLMPGNSRVRYNTLLDDYARFETEAAESRFNRYTDAPTNRSASSPAASPTTTSRRIIPAAVRIPC